MRPFKEYADQFSTVSVIWFYRIIFGWIITILAFVFFDETCGSILNIDTRFISGYIWSINPKLIAIKTSLSFNEIISCHVIISKVEGALVLELSRELPPNSSRSFEEVPIETSQTSFIPSDIESSHAQPLLGPVANFEEVTWLAIAKFYELDFTCMFMHHYRTDTIVFSVDFLTLWCNGVSRSNHWCSIAVVDKL